jgi:phosphoribosylpyrophosphate synthetase
VRARIGNPPIVALTATADPRVRDDIVQRLGLVDPVVHVAGFDRPNLRFDTVRVSSKKQKAEGIAAKLRQLTDESAIVYCGTRKNVEELTDYLQTQRIKCARYHAGMEDAERRRIRGYDQAVLLAEAAAAGLRLPTHAALARARPTRPQFELGREHRMLNVADAFLVREDSKAAVSGRWIVLVDDVATTGATLVACAHALLAAGASGVSACTLAREA